MTSFLFKVRKQKNLREIKYHSNVEIMHGNSLSTLFGQKFREIDCFTKEVTKELISRNIFVMRKKKRKISWKQFAM